MRLPTKSTKQRTVCRDTLARLHHEGHDHEQIAAIMGFSASTIKQRLGRMFPKVQEVVEIRRQDILPLWQSGATMPELAAHFGCSETTLRNKLRHLHLPRRAWIARQWQIIEDKPDPDKPVEEPATMTGRLLATKGRYSELAKIAEKHSLTFRQVQQQYHQARTGR
jgi:lambda repressor-like predicted transcriptional regulator